MEEYIEQRALEQHQLAIKAEDRNVKVQEILRMSFEQLKTVLIHKSKGVVKYQAKCWTRSVFTNKKKETVNLLCSCKEHG